MTTYVQFFHMSNFGRTPQRGQRAWSCIAGITAEAARLHGATGHLTHPEPPTQLFGVSPVDAGRIALERLADALDSRGRRLRSDAAAMVAAVASYPVPRSIVMDPSDPTQMTTYLRWRSLTEAWMQERFGDTLESIVEHTDESFLHVHGYAVPKLGDDRRLQLDSIHPGRAAVSAAIQAGQAKGRQQAIYKAAMKALQDDFHTSVSVHFGHERAGPKRRRK